MKFEYAVKYFSKRTGECAGISAHTHRSKEDAAYYASNHNRQFPNEEARVVRREVGEWEVVK